MLHALSAGEQDPEALADLARGKLRSKLPVLRQALQGRVKPYHLSLLMRILAHIEFLEESLTQLPQDIEQHLAPFADAVTLLQDMPGVGPVAAATIVAEIGIDMSRFPSAKHLASWAGVCPGNKQSGGKRLSGAATKGNPWLRAVLGEVATAISRSRNNYLSAQFRRLARRGKPKAILAVAHSVLRIIYDVLRDKKPYSDLGPHYFDKRDTARLERHHIHRLEQLGFTVTLTPKEVA